MSTPSGKPLGPVRISDYAPKRFRDRMAAANDQAGGDRPERPSEAQSELDEVERDAQSDDDVEGQAHPTPLAPIGAHERDARYRHRDEASDDSADSARGYDAEEDDGEDDRYLDAGESADESEEAEPSSGRAYASGRAAYDDERAAYEVDLQRLEDDLLSLRRGGEAPPRRLPRAEQLPPTRGLRSPDETYIDGFRLPRSLEPSFLPPPPLQERSNHWMVVRRALIATAVAAPIAWFLTYYFTAVMDAPSPPAAPKLASASTQMVSLPPLPPPLKVQETAPAPAQQAALSQPPQQAAPPPPQRAAAVALPPTQQPPQQVQLSQPPAVASASQSPGPPAWPARQESTGVAPAPSNPTPPRPASPPPHEMSADDIAMLMQQAEQFIGAGDVVTARVLFRRAAEAGDAKAALSMGATFDPALLAKIGVRGIAPDIVQARSWYEKAREFGSSEAVDRLERLSAR